MCENKIKPGAVFVFFETEPYVARSFEVPTFTTITKTAAAKFYHFDSNTLI
jgi:hypothetical protein